MKKLIAIVMMALLCVLTSNADTVDDLAVKHKDADIVLFSGGVIEGQGRISNPLEYVVLYIDAKKVYIKKKLNKKETCLTIATPFQSDNLAVFILGNGGNFSYSTEMLIFSYSPTNDGTMIGYEWDLSKTDKWMRLTGKI